MTTRYPSQIDNSTSLPTIFDNISGITASTVNILRDTSIAIEATLGVKPQGLFTTVRARLDALELLVQSAIIGEITFSGDLSGTVTHQTVIGLQTNPIHAAVLGLSQDGYVLTWDGGQWIAQPTSDAFIGNGDISGNAISQTVIGWENKLLDAATMGSPTDGYIPVWVAGSNKWKALSPESVIGELTLAGDVTGVANNNTVIKLQHNPIIAQSLGSSQDGYVLTWDNVDGYWAAKQNRPLQNITTITANYLVVATDKVIAVGSISGPITVTLPSSASIGQIFIVKDEAGNASTFNIVINGNGHNIDGSSTITLAQNYGSISLVYFGSSWGVI